MPSESLLRVSSAPGGRYGTFYTRRWKLSNLDPSSPPGGRYDAFYTRRRKLSNLDPLSTESNISGPETKKSPRAKEDEMMAMCGSWASPFSQTSASQPPSELIHGQCLGDSSDCGPSRRPSLGGSPIGSDVGSDQAVARTPRAPRTSYSEEQKFFIMYARVVKDHTWPEIEDQFNAIFGFRTKGALTSVYYRVRKDWGLTEVLKTGPGSYVADCKEVERRARKFSASFLVEIGYLADSDESQTVAMLQFRHKAPQNARATVAESISLLKSAPQQHIPITQLLSTDRPSVSGSPTDFAISGEISQAASSDTGSNTHTEPQDVASANMGGSARFTQATTMGTVFDEEESDESMAPTRQCRSPEISNPHAASCDDPYLFVAVNGTTNSRDLVQMRRKRKHVLQDYLDKERKKPKTTDARITGNGKRRRLEPSLLSMSVHSGVPATMFMESRVKLVSGSQEKATWEQTVSSDSTKVMTPAPHTIHTDLLDDAKGVDQEPRPETRASSVDADVRPEEDIVEDLTASSRYSTKRHQIDQPVSEQKSRPRCASTDAVDLADAFLGLKKRLQRLLILTEPKTPSLSSDSDSEEPIDPLNFESPDGSPGLRQCASGHESSSNGSLHLADALPASGRQSSQHGRRSINDGDQEEDESIAQPGGARTSDPQSSKLQRYPCVYHVGEPQIYASHTTRWEYVSQVL